MNNGNCVNLAGNEVTCECFNDFTGQYCETPPGKKKGFCVVIYVKTPQKSLQFLDIGWLNNRCGDVHFIFLV